MKRIDDLRKANINADLIRCAEVEIYNYKGTIYLRGAELPKSKLDNYGLRLARDDLIAVVGSIDLTQWMPLVRKGKSDFKISFREHYFYPRKEWHLIPLKILATPFTLVADIVSYPYQLYYHYAYAGGGRPHGFSLTTYWHPLRDGDKKKCLELIDRLKKAWQIEAEKAGKKQPAQPKVARP